jgi:peptidoglycan/LPS O-acetylase OafA/YrhL
VVAIGITMAGAWPKRGVDFLAHVVMLQDYTGSVFVPAFWSLGAEEKFYLLAPLLVFVLARGPSPRSGQAAVGVWQGCGLLVLWLIPVMWRAWAVGSLTSVVTYAAYFPQYRSPFHLTCESLVLGFAIAWLSLQPWHRRITRPIREGLFWAGMAGVTYVLASSVILDRIDARTIVIAPSLIGIYFGAMVLAAVSGPGSYSRVFGWSTWRPLATGSYALYLTHMMILPVAGALAAIAPLTSGASLTARWVAFMPWYLTLTVMSAYLLHRFVERPVLTWRDSRLQSDDSTRVGAVSRAA